MPHQPIFHIQKHDTYELCFHMGADGKYVLDAPIRYYSPRYHKWITVPAGFPSDGATGAEDIMSRAWFIHDWLCTYYEFDDGTYCSRWQGSMILGDVLAEEGRWFRRVTWPIATFVAGIFSDCTPSDPPLKAA